MINIKVTVALRRMSLGRVHRVSMEGNALQTKLSRG